MRAIAVSCPNCGARLEVAGASNEVRCAYCGTASRVQRRSRVLERALPPPVARPDGPARVAVQRRSGVITAIIAGAVIVPLIITIVIVAMVSRTVDRATRAARTAGTSGGGGGALADAPPEWQGTEGALVVDVDGDGALDVIGRSRRVHAEDTIRIVALDGARGDVRWESVPLGSYMDTYQGHLVLAGDLVLYISTRAEVRAFGAADGAPRWTAQLDERVERVCDRDDALAIVGTDGVERRLARADGARVVPAEAPAPDAGAAGAAAARKPRPRPARPPAPCPALPTDQHDARGRQADPTDADRAAARALGLYPDAVATGPSSGSGEAPRARVLSGSRETGTRVATLALLDGRGGARWRVEVPREPLAAIERAAMNVVVGPRAACATYYTDSVARPLRAACFALDDGRRLWDEELADDPLSALIVVGDAVLVSQWGRLEARALDTGAVRWRFGE